MKKQIKLNNRGIAHLFLLMGVVVVVAAVGTYFLIASRAATSYTINTTADNTDVSLVNNERSSRGIKTLSRGSALDYCAVKQAKAMASSQTLYHNPKLRECISSKTGVVGTSDPPTPVSKISAGENVGYGPSVSAVHKAFMASSAHKANILDKSYNRIGVGVAVDSHGRYWICEVYRDL